ncbi:SEC14, partial [Symbiodinium pilosum]
YSDVRYLVDSVVLLRLLRVFSLESYYYALHTLQCVLWLNKWPLARAGGALVSVWFVHATLLYICENPRALGGAIPPVGPDDAGEGGHEKGEGEGEDDDGLTMVQRYRSVLSALQYSIVHLFGDFPETDYTTEAKMVHFAGIMGGIAIISTFCGVFSAGFVDYLETSRHQEVSQMSSDFLSATVKMKIGLKKAIENRRARINSGQSSFVAQEDCGKLGIHDGHSQNRQSSIVERPQELLVNMGAWIQLVFNFVLVVSLINTMFSSIPQDNTPAAATACLIVEGICTLVFVADYAAQLSMVGNGWCFSQPKARMTKSCQAAALGPNPNPRELRELDRALPQYMVDYCNGDARKAMNKWVETLKWRCEIDDEGIFAQPSPDFFTIQRHYPTFLHLPDKAGRMTYWVKVGDLNPPGLDKDGMTVERIRDDYLWQTLFTWDVWLKRDDKQYLTIVLDMEGFALSKITPKMMRVFAASYGAVQAHMPDRERLVIVVNAPEWWRTVWAVFKPFLPERQQERLRVSVGQEESINLLRELIPPKNLPKSYGGSGIELGKSPANVLRQKYAAEGTGR